MAKSASKWCNQWWITNSTVRQPNAQFQFHLVFPSLDIIFHFTWFHFSGHFHWMLHFLFNSCGRFCHHSANILFFPLWTYFIYRSLVDSLLLHSMMSEFEGWKTWNQVLQEFNWYVILGDKNLFGQWIMAIRGEKEFSFLIPYCKFERLNSQLKIEWVVLNEVKLMRKDINHRLHWISCSSSTVLQLDQKFHRWLGKKKIHLVYTKNFNNAQRIPIHFMKL